MIASAMVHALLLATDLPAAGAGADELSRQFDDVLAAPAVATAPRAQSATGSGLMNPDLSVIFDGVAGAANRSRASSAGDDPDFSGSAPGHTGGIAIQEVEIGFQSNVDPYFTARVYLTIPNLRGVEVEEAYAMTT